MIQNPKPANYQDLLKIIAVITMIIDHTGLYFFPDELYLRVIGRSAMPIFMFFAGYNFKGRISPNLVYAAIFLFCFDFVARLYWGVLVPNILLSILLGQIYLHFLSSYIANFWLGYAQAVLIACLWPWSQDLFDYGTLGIAVMIIGAMAQRKAASLFLLIFATIGVSALHSYFAFDILHDPYYLRGLGAIYIGLSIIFSLYRFEKPMPAAISSIKFISRHTMLIYIANLVMNVLIWQY